MSKNAITPSFRRLVTLIKFCKLNVNLLLFFVISLIKETQSAALPEDSSICAEYPRLSLCQLRPILENALTEIDFLVNGIGVMGHGNDGIYTDIQQTNREIAKPAESPTVILQTKRKRTEFHPIISTKFTNMPLKRLKFFPEIFKRSNRSNNKKNNNDNIDSYSSQQQQQQEQQYLIEHNYRSLLPSSPSMPTPLSFPLLSINEPTSSKVSSMASIAYLI